MKAVAERLNSLQVDILGRTLESIFHGVEVQDIPVNYYNTLLCPTYVLDMCLQSAGGAHFAKMGTAFMNWGIPWALAFLRRQHGISVESHHRQSKSPIPCGIRQ